MSWSITCRWGSLFIFCHLAHCFLKQFSLTVLFFFSTSLLYLFYCLDSIEWFSQLKKTPLTFRIKLLIKNEGRVSEMLGKLNGCRKTHMKEQEVSFAKSKNPLSHYQVFHFQQRFSMLLPHDSVDWKHFTIPYLIVWTLKSGQPEIQKRNLQRYFSKNEAKS